MAQPPPVRNDSKKTFRRARKRIEPEPGFAALVRNTRETKGMSQLELARLAGVSPKTLINVEKKGIARFDAIIRIANALGQPVEDWIKLAGHHVSRGRIEDVLAQTMVVAGGATAFRRMSPEQFFERTRTRIREHPYALRCICLNSPIQVDTPKLSEQIAGVLSEGLHLAIVCPFPIGDVRMALRLRGLTQYYGDVHNWACKAAVSLREKVSTAKDRIHVFTPMTPATGSFLVSPATRIAESRPIFTIYNPGPGIEERRELGTYMHFMDGRQDQWIETYSGEGPKTARVDETLAIWHDYFREIIDAWEPSGPKKESVATYKLSEAMFWRETPL